jgi:hypothetical protein
VAAKKKPQKMLVKSVRRPALERIKPIFVEARRAMVHAARSTFAEYGEEHPSETFYAFALYADNYGHAITPAAHTEEAYRKRLAKNSMYKENELGLLRYCPEEWDPDYAGSVRLEQWAAVADVLGPVLGDESLTWHQAARPVFEAMTAALADLDKEGFFGRGGSRDKLTLMIWGRDRDELWAPSIKRLNSPKVYAQFTKSGIPKRFLR